MKNKKAFTTMAIVIIAFSLMAAVYFFSSVLVYESGKDYVINVLSDTGRDIISNNTVASVNASVTQAINDTQTGYNNFLFPFDIFFLLMFITVFISTIVASFKSNKDGIFSFMGYVFIGSLMLLLITSFSNDFTVWFMSELFSSVFSDSTISTPIFSAYLNNLGLINFIWWLVLIIVNVIDRNIISRTGEVEE